MAINLPDGLISMSELGIFAEVEDIENDDNFRDMADLVIRSTGVIIRFTAQQPEWTAETIPYEVRVIALEFARRVFNNPQVQQRIQTGPLGESYSTDELTGMALKDSEVETLETFIPEEEGSLGDLAVVKSVRPDPLDYGPNNNAVRAIVFGLGGGLVNGKMPTMPLPSLAKYLGVERN